MSLTYAGGKLYVMRHLLPILLLSATVTVQPQKVKGLSSPAWPEELAPTLHKNINISVVSLKL